MKIRTLLFVICILFVFLIPRPSQPCTTFCLDEGTQLVVGKNFDWTVGDALVIVNKRNVSKTALSNQEEDSQPVSWTSQYGSITFHSLGREFPMGGMNEAGLVVEGLILSATEYPEQDSRTYIGQLQWTQYQLDNFSTVEQVIATDSQLRILQDFPGLHYFATDSKGDSALIEFIEGEMVYYTKETLPVEVMTNSTTYAECVEYWEKDEIPTPDPSDSVKRFITAANMMADYDFASEFAVDYSFNILSNVTWFVPTQYSIVYDIQNLRIYFHAIDNEQIRYVDLNSFDFSCKTPVKVLDIKEDLSGDVSDNFVDYTYEINRELIKKTNVFGFSDEALDYLAQYPETTVCTEIDCFIATAAYGSPMEPQVEVLREFRDRFLLDNRPGKIFVLFYNTYSPELADFMARHDNLRTVVRLGLLPLVGVSWIALKLGPIPTMVFMLLPMALIGTAAVIVSKRRWLRRYRY